MTLGAVQARTRADGLAFRSWEEGGLLGGCGEDGREVDEERQKRGGEK